MIAVLADDLSGAAELAGIAFHHGLSVEVQTVFDPATESDVICVDSDTRLLTADEAGKRVAEIARAILAAHPAWIFKKCDSVLRGHVLAEARAVAEAAGLRRVRLVPANPSRGRIIENGRYLIEGKPLDRTPFARDSHHPRHTARVKDLLGDPGDEVGVPDILTTGDVQREARLLDARTLPTGAADFFRALLAVRIPARPPAPQPPVTTGRTLVVCGSAAAWPQRAQEAARHAVRACPLPHDHDTLVRALTADGRVLLGIGEGPVTREKSSRELTRELIDTAIPLFLAARPERLLLEGGDTAAAFMRATGWSRLRVVGAIADAAVLEPVGVTPAPRLHIKPGSYAWPAELWPPRNT